MLIYVHLTSDAYMIPKLFYSDSQSDDQGGMM